MRAAWGEAEEVRVCAYCGKIVTDEEAIEDGVECGDDWFDDIECAHNEGWEICENCGEWTHSDEYIMPSGANGVYCSASCAELAGYRECMHCDEWHLEADGYYVSTRENGDEWWCDWCGESDAYWHENEDCYMDYPDDSYSDDDDDDDDRGGVRDYHAGRQMVRTAPGVLLFGCEVEVESSEREELAEWAREHNHRAERDGSLDDAEGVEIITRPLSFEDARAAVAAIVEEARRLGSRSHDGGNCGFHVHLSRAGMGDDGWKRFDAIYRRIEGRLWALSRRTEDRWCKRPSPLVVARDILSTGALYPSLRQYNAINFANSLTVEVRTCRGSLKPHALTSWVAVLHGIAEVAREGVGGGHGWAWILQAREEEIWAEVLRRSEATEEEAGYIAGRVAVPAGIMPRRKTAIPEGARIVCRSARKRAQRAARSAASRIIRIAA